MELKQLFQQFTAPQHETQLSGTHGHPSSQGLPCEGIASSVEIAIKQWKMINVVLGMVAHIYNPTLGASS